MTAQTALAHRGGGDRVHRRRRSRRLPPIRQPLSVVPSGLSGAVPALDLVLEEISPGHALFTCNSVAVEGRAAPRTAGICSRLLELTLSATVQSALEAGAGYRVLRMRMQFVHPEHRLTRCVSSVGDLVRSGPGVVTASARVVDADGAVRARGLLVAAVDAPWSAA